MAIGIRFGGLAEKELLWGDGLLSLRCLDDLAKDTPCSQVFRASLASLFIVGER